MFPKGGEKMGHIGFLVRSARKQKKISAEFVGARLKRPITGQAFAQHERGGTFQWEIVLEISRIIGVNPKKFLSSEKLKVS